MVHLRIKDLPCRIAGLFKDLAPVLGIGVVTKVCTFIQETVAIIVNNDSKGVTVFLKGISDCQVAELRSVVFLSDGVSATPIAVGHCPDIESHSYAVTSVKSGAPDLCEVPTWT